MKRQILIAVMLLAASLAVAADYYVSSIHPERSDSNVGTDVNAPWATFGKIRTAWGGLNAGDTVHLERGSLWGISPSSDYWYITQGGSAAGHITIRGDDYGSGALPILKRVGGSGQPAFIMIEASYVTVRDFVLDGAYQDHGIDGGGIIIGDANGDISHVNVLNMTVKNLGGSSTQYVCGIWLVSFGGFAVSDALIAGNTVSDYSAHGLNHYSQGDMRNIIWRGNTVINAFPGSRFPSANSALQIRSGSEGCVFEYNYLEDRSTTEGNVFVFGKRYDDIDAIQIRYNVIANSSSDGLMYTIDHRDMKVLGDIYGNIIYGNHRAGIAVFPADSYAPGSTLRFYNNTLYNNYTAGGSDSETGEVIFDNNTSNTSISFFNNLICHPTYGATVGLAVKPPFAGTYTHGNNLYWHLGGSSFPIVEHNVAYTANTVLNYEPSAQSSNPLFQNTAQLPTVISSLGGVHPDGLLPQSGSAALENGTDVGAAYAGSIDNIPRPYGAAWDIGAYEAGDVPTPLSAPSDAAATPVSTTAIDLAWTDNATDETGFRIERSLDGVAFTEIATTTSNVTAHADTGLTEDTSYTYRVRAYRDGTNSEYSNSDTARTLAPPDVTPPALAYVHAADNPTAAILVFSEPLDPVAAQNVSNYTLDNSIRVTGATLAGSVVTLRVQPALSDQVIYVLGVANLTDAAGNPISTGTEASFTYQQFDPSLAGWYVLNGSAVDLSPNQNNGTVNGATVVIGGQFNEAYRFDGVDDYIEVPLQGVSPAQGTIAMWVYPYAFVGGQYLFGHTAQGDWGQRIQLYTDAADGVLDLGLGDTHEAYVGVAALQLQQWQHLGLTWNGTTFAIYLDGVLRAQGPYSGLTTLSAFADIGNTGLIGLRSEAFDGVIDDVRLYARPLLAPEILSISKSLNIPRRPEGVRAEL